MARRRIDGRRHGSLRCSGIRLDGTSGADVVEPGAFPIGNDVRLSATPQITGADLLARTSTGLWAVARDHCARSALAHLVLFDRSVAHHRVGYRLRKIFQIMRRCPPNQPRQPTPGARLVTCWTSLARRGCALR